MERWWRTLTKKTELYLGSLGILRPRDSYVYQPCDSIQPAKVTVTVKSLAGSLISSYFASEANLASLFIYPLCDLKQGT